ncbi:MAG: hypothetical protein AAGB31_02970, partial [Bdellovibrio sp.]
MKSVLLIALGFMSLYSYAQRREVGRSAQGDGSGREVCEYGSSGTIKTSTPSETPNYFFRTFNHGGKEYVSYAGNAGLYLLDLKSGKEHFFTGPYDPVPLGEDIITVPDEMRGITLYSVKSILAGQNRP